MANDKVSLGRAVISKQTAKALYVVTEEHGSFWIPQSVIHDNSDVWDEEKGPMGELIIKSWYAREKGFM